MSKIALYLALAGAGTAGAVTVMVATGMIEPQEMAGIARAGGVGEMLGHFFDKRGRPVGREITDRILTQPLDQLSGRRIVAVAGGTLKTDAIKAILESGLLSGLIIDEHTARAIVDLDTPAPAQH